jgi:hypothetical protein
MVILVLDRIIQWRLLPISVCASVYIGTVGDQSLGGSLIRLWIAGTTARTAHRDGVKSSRSDNRVLIDISATLQQQLNGLSAASIRAPREWRQPPVAGRVIHVCA